MRQFLLSLFLTLISVSVFSQCAGNISYTLSVPPSANNTYPPGTVVELCITMDGWNGNNQGSNWFEGFYIALGGGWQTVTPTLFPQDAEAASGDWIWTTLTTSDNGATSGPGFFFEGPSGPTDGNPGNDWGDSCPSTTCVWSCCVELVAASGPSGLDLHIGVIPYSDGTMGSWGIQACNETQTILFQGSIGCFVPGCIDPNACNYNLNADCDNNSCTYSGCTDVTACNYDINAGCDDGSCTYSGCIDPLACNFDSLAGCDDGSCNYFSMGTISPNPDTVCVNTNTFYSVIGNSTSLYDWSVTGGTVNTNQSVNCNVNWGNIPGDYTLSVQETTPAGCVSPIVTCDVVIVDPKVTFDSSYRICYNQSVTLSANPPGGNWSGDYINGSTFVGSVPGISRPIYTTNIHNCVISNSVEVIVETLYQSPSLLYSKLDLDLCFDPNDQTYTAVDDRSTSFVWTINGSTQSSNDNTLFISWYDTTNTYLINVYGIDNLGCKSNTTGINLHTNACQRFFAPNSFTPNGDGINDIFEVRGLSVYKPIVKIFNRWGVEVYVSSNLYWTGDSGSGYYCDNGVYNWIIEYKDKDGFNKIQKGFVTLIR